MGRPALMIRAEFTDPQRLGVSVHLGRRIIRLSRRSPQAPLGSLRDFMVDGPDGRSIPATLTLTYELT
jgi:hypothetical protein